MYKIFQIRQLVERKEEFEVKIKDDLYRDSRIVKYNGEYFLVNNNKEYTLQELVNREYLPDYYFDDEDVNDNVNI